MPISFTFLPTRSSFLPSIPGNKSIALWQRTKHLLMMLTPPGTSRINHERRDCSAIRQSVRKRKGKFANFWQVFRLNSKHWKRENMHNFQSKFILFHLVTLVIGLNRLPQRGISGSLAVPMGNSASFATTRRHNRSLYSVTQQRLLARPLAAKRISCTWSVKGAKRKMDCSYENARHPFEMGSCKNLDHYSCRLDLERFSFFPKERI